MLLLILQSVLSLIIIIATAWPDLENKNKKHFKKLKGRGWLIVTLVIMGALIQIIQFNTTKNQEKQLISTYTNKIYEIDSLAKIREDSSVMKVVRSFAESFARYGLKYDTAAQKIERLIKDSAKQTIVTSHPPSLDICPEQGVKLQERDGDKYVFTLYFCNSNAPSKNFSSKVVMALTTSARDTILLKHPVIYNKEDFLNFQDDLRIGIPLYYIQKREVESTIFWLQGSYEDFSGKKYPFYRIIILKHKDGSVWGPSGNLLRHLQSMFNHYYKF